MDALTPAPRGLASRLRALALALALAVAWSAAAPAAAAEAVSREYAVKAAFLLNFTRFVEWPESAFAAPDEPLRIGVLGVDPFGPALEGLVRGEQVRGRPIAVLRGRRVDELARCHLVFVAASESGALPAALERLRPLNALTVSDVPGFAAAGGIIELRIVEHRVRFVINQPEAAARGLKVSAQLLSLALPPPEPRP